MVWNCKISPTMLMATSSPKYYKSTIESLKWYTVENNILFSAGWIQVWELTKKEKLYYKIKS